MTKPCRVCALPTTGRCGVDAALALEIHGPAWIARRFLNLTKRDIKHHRDRYLCGDPLLAVAEQRGWLEDLEASEVDATPDPPGGA